MIDLQIAKKPLRVSSIKTRIKTRDLLLSGRILSLRVSSIKTRIKTLDLRPELFFIPSESIFH